MTRSSVRARQLYRLLRRRLHSCRDASLWGNLGLLAPAVSRMAVTGNGTDDCLEQGCLPMLVHYYSPVPDIGDLRARRVWDRRSPMAGIDMREPQQLTLLAKLGCEFGAECRWLQRWSESSGALNPLAGQAEVVAEMAPMILGPGPYRVQVELLSDGRTLATAGVVFKVVAERALTDGQPVLWAPIEVSCRPRVAAER